MSHPDPASSRQSLDRPWTSRSQPLRLLTCVSALALLASVVGAQELTHLRDEYVTESRMLDGDLGNYLDARDNEEVALRRWSELNRRLDRAMSDASVPAAELVRLHNEIAQARRTAVAISEDAGDRREEMGQRMRRMQAILEELRQGGVSYVEPNGAVGGTWLVETNEGLGLLSLTQSAGRLSGTYRLSNGRHGTVSGRFGNRFKVDLADSDYGPVGSLVGELDASGDLNGEWSARELAQGRPTGGTWSARRLSFEDLLTLNP